MSHAAISRRRFVKGIGATALTGSMAPGAVGRAAEARQPHGSRPDTPKICMGMSSRASEADMRRIKQLGVDHVLMGGPAIPWQESAIRDTMERFKAGGLTVCNMMISGFPNTIYGRPGRDEEIAKVKESVAAAGKAGLPVVEYNFYAHRAMEGYYEVIGRAGAGYTGFDYERMKDLGPLPEEGAHTLEEMWANISVLPRGRRPRGRAVRGAAGPAPQRSAGAAQPRIGADHGHRRRLETAHRDREQPRQRDHLRLRGDARDWRGPRGRLPVFRDEGPDQPRALQERADARAARRSTRRCSSTKATSTCSR